MQPSSKYIISSGMHKLWGYDRQQNMGFISLYRSSHHTKDKWIFFKDLQLSLEHNINKSLILIGVLGDFNARAKSWYKNHITAFGGSKIDIATSSFGLSEKMNQCMFWMISSCIDLIFTSQPPLVIYSGVLILP